MPKENAMLANTRDRHQGRVAIASGLRKNRVDTPGIANHFNSLSTKPPASLGSANGKLRTDQPCGDPRLETLSKVRAIFLATAARETSRSAHLRPLSANFSRNSF